MASISLPASTSLVPGLLAAGVLYAVYRAAAPFIAIRRHLKEARTVGLPVQILPVPQGLFSFFAFQVATKLRLVRPGSWLHRILNAGRPDGHSAHKDLGKYGSVTTRVTLLTVYSRRLFSDCQSVWRRSCGGRRIRSIICVITPGAIP
jgi:hypothetical protein